MYCINYSLALYFKEEWVKAVKASFYFYFSFDETLGDFQEEQLNCHACYCGDIGKEVCSRHLECYFLRHPNV